MYVRSVIATIDPDSGCRQGVFQALSALKPALSEEDRAEADALTAWFDHNLKAPDRLSLTRRPHGKAQAICWFRDTARDHIRRMRAIVTLLDRYGIASMMLVERQPGYIVHADEWQVAACPFAKTGT